MTAPAPDCRIAGRTLPVFRLCGYVGFAAGSATAVAGAFARGLDVGRMALLCALAAVTYYLISRAQWVVTGRVNLVWYHYLLPVLALSAAVAPSRAYLDAEAAGLGVFHAIARLGCHAAGCCHGRPWRGGVVYGSAHVAAGFPAYYAGVPLAPVQLLEAALALTAAITGRGVTGYLAIYAGGRFGLELLRGDGCRTFRGGLTGAQWTSLAVLAAVGYQHAWIAAVIPVLLALRWWAGRRQLIRPADLAGVVSTLRRAARGLTVFRTAGGLNISCSPDHVAFSLPGGLTPAHARSLARLVEACRLGTTPRVIRSSAGVVHVSI